MREEEVKRRKVKGKEKQIGKKKEEQRWESEISNAIRNKKESGNDEGKGGDEGRIERNKGKDKNMDET